jgi:hypothetical protein
MKNNDKKCIDLFGKLILNDLPDGVFIAGGCLRDYYSGRNPFASDIDVFFQDKAQRRVSLEYLNSKSELLYENENVTRLLYKNLKIDIVNKFYESPEHCINSFDFTVAMIAVDKNTVYMDERTLYDLAKRQLMINKITYPLSTLSRVLKYVRKGYKICNEELTKVYESCRAGKPSDEQILPQQNGSFGFAGID